MILGLQALSSLNWALVDVIYPIYNGDVNRIDALTEAGLRGVRPTAASVGEGRARRGGGGVESAGCLPGCDLGRGFGRSKKHGRQARSPRPVRPQPVENVCARNDYYGQHDESDVQLVDRFVHDLLGHPSEFAIADVYGLNDRF